MDKEKTQPTKIGKTWFFERGDGKIFACGESEAWNLIRNKSNWQRNDFKMIGVSDGQTYVKALKLFDEEKNIIDREVKRLSADLTRYLGTLDKLKFDELADDNDPKVIKVNGIIAGIQKQIDELQEKFKNGYQDIVDKAFKAELKKAKGKIEYPRNQDIATPSGDREAILRSMGK